MLQSHLDRIAITAPSLQAGVHPAFSLQDSGCTLVRLEGFHPEAEKVRNVLESIGFEGDFSVSPLPPDQKPYLVAHIQTSAGLRQLSAPELVAQQGGAVRGATRWLAPRSSFFAYLVIFFANAFD